MSVDLTEPKVIRNSRIGLAVLFAASLLCLVATPCAAVVALTFLFPLARFSSDLMFDVLAWGCAAYLSGSAALFLYRLASGMKHNHVMLTHRGVCFGITSGEQAIQEFFAWSDIRAVTCTRFAHVCVCSVQGPHGRFFYFDSYTFLRPRRIAEIISTRIRTGATAAP